MKRHIHTIMLLLLVACLTCGNVVHASADIFDTDLVEQYEVAPRYKKLLSSSASIEIDIEGNKKYLESKNEDTVNMTEDQIKKALTGENVFLSSQMGILDAM